MYTPENKPCWNDLSQSICATNESRRLIGGASSGYTFPPVYHSGSGKKANFHHNYTLKLASHIFFNATYNIKFFFLPPFTSLFTPSIPRRTAACRSDRCALHLRHMFTPSVARRRRRARSINKWRLPCFCGGFTPVERGAAQTLHVETVKEQKDRNGLSLF